MSRAKELIDYAFQKLREMPGFSERVDQIQLALLIGDGISDSTHLAIEAPTGLGKSLAALIPAIAHALDSGKRTCICTYTNVLAEQYWRKDLPLAMSLFEGFPDPTLTDIKTQFLVGRQRYACLIAIDEAAPHWADVIRTQADIGIESDVMPLMEGVKSREVRQVWSAISVPPVCASKACPLYDDCFYYSARKKAESAHIIITNHSIVLSDALQSQLTGEKKGFLGKLDYLVVDEAHDLYASAIGSLEFEFSTPRLNAVTSIMSRIEREVNSAARGNGAEPMWRKFCDGFRHETETLRQSLSALKIEIPETCILAVSPVELDDHPGVKQRKNKADYDRAAALLEVAGAMFERYANAVEALLSTWEGIPKGAAETVRIGMMYIREFSDGCRRLIVPSGVSVSYASPNLNETILRQDVVDVADPLRELLWDRVPSVCMSATLCVDNEFEWFCRTVGFTPFFSERLPSPFDFASNAALYVPAVGAVPDPSTARAQGTEEEYFHAIAKQLTSIISAMQGRTLALFHSRREMEAVYARMPQHDDFPIFAQTKQGAARAGDKFKSVNQSSLFALRSFWTGFDAPGDTCSCVVVVRIPFEVPVDPPAVVRMAYMQSIGQEPFMQFTLPMAKMMVRQGVGRLIRTVDDKGVIALIDPRLRTKRYGEDIIMNLPQDIREFSDIWDAAAWTGLGSDTDPLQMV